jgi:hypothetical protein
MASRLEQLVGWAAEADLFVVISFRTGPGRGEGDITEDGLADATVFDDEDQQAAWAQMWSSVAADYASHPHVVGYDLMVEPHDVDVQSWRSFAQDLVFAIRTVDDETPILVSPAGWGSYDALEGFEPLTDPAARLVYTVHQYEPFGYTHGGDDPSFEALEGQLSEIYGAIGVWRAEHGEVIAVGEFGFDVDGLKGTSIDFMDAQIARIEELGGAHMVWEWQAQAAGWHDFDVRSNAEYLQLMQMWWASNEVYPSLLR